MLFPEHHRALPHPPPPEPLRLFDVPRVLIAHHLQCSEARDREAGRGGRESISVHPVALRSRSANRRSGPFPRRVTLPLPFSPPSSLPPLLSFAEQRGARSLAEFDDNSEFTVNGQDA